MKKLIDKQKQAVYLRKEGNTYSEIKNILNVSKGSLSMWLKNVNIENIERYNEKIHDVNLKNNINAISTKKGKYIVRKTELRDNIKFLYCYRCKEMKPESKFHNRNGKFYKSSWCKECLKAYLRERWELAIIHLGGKCDCGCNIIDVLEIHHKKGNGKEERKTCKGVVFYNKILRMPVEEAKKEYAVDCLTCHGADHIILKHPNIKYQIKFIKE